MKNGPDAPAPSAEAAELENLMNPPASAEAAHAALEPKPDAAAAPAKEAPDAKAPAKKDPPADADPEIDFGDGVKLKRSAAKDLLAKGQDYSKKTEELTQRAQNVKQFEELAEKLSQSPQKLQKILSILEAKDEAAAAAADGSGSKAAAEAANAKAKSALEAALEKLDPEDPAAAVLKHLIEETKTTNAMLKTFQEREETLRKQEAETQQKLQDAESQKQYQATVKEAGETLTSTIESTFKELKIEHQEEQTAVKNLALSIIKDNPKKIESKEDWAKVVKDATTKAHGIVQAAIQAHVASYVKSKSSPVIPSGGAKSGDPAPKTPTMETLQDVLEAELTKADAARNS